MFEFYILRPHLCLPTCLFSHEWTGCIDPYMAEKTARSSNEQVCCKSVWMNTACATTVHCCPISQGQVGTTSNYGDGVQIHPCSPDSDNPHWSPHHLSSILLNRPTMESKGGRHGGGWGANGGTYSAWKQCTRVTQFRRHSIREAKTERNMD